MEENCHGLIHGTMLVSCLREEGKSTPPKKVWITSLQLRNKPVTTQIRNRSDSNFTTMYVSSKKVCS
jgi:hypothetical protein